MVAFYFLLTVALVALWFLLAFAYKPIGKFLSRIFKDTKETMEEEDE